MKKLMALCAAAHEVEQSNTDYDAIAKNLWLYQSWRKSCVISTY